MVELVPILLNMFGCKWRILIDPLLNRIGRNWPRHQLWTSLTAIGIFPQHATKSQIPFYIWILFTLHQKSGKCHSNYKLFAFPNLRVAATQPTAIIQLNRHGFCTPICLTHTQFEKAFPCTATSHDRKKKILFFVANRSLRRLFYYFSNVKNYSVLRIYFHDFE